MTTQAQDKYLPGPQRILLNILISLTTFMYVLDYSVANVALPYIAGDLAVSVDQGTYVITAFAVGNAIGLPLTGWLSRTFGRVRVFVASVALFTFLSWICGISFSFDMIIVGRFIQGLVAGPIVPLSQGFIAEVNPPKSTTKAIAAWALIIMVAPVIGPVLGGWICVNYTWPWIFLINVPFGVICALGIAILLKGRESVTMKKSFDYLGFFLFALGATCLQVFLDKGQDWDWLNSHRMRILGVTFILCYIYLIPFQFIKKDPFLNLRVFRFRSFYLATILMAISYASYFGSIVLIPLWLQSYMGYDAYWAGVAIAPLGLFPVLLSPIIPKLIDKLGILPLLMITMCFFIASFIYILTFTTNVDVIHIGISRIIMGIGFATFAAPLNLLAMREVSVDEMPGALGIFHFVRSMSGGIGTSLFTTLWQRRGIHHHFRISERINDYREPVVQGMETYRELSFNAPQSTVMMNRLVDKQAYFLSLLDAFYAMIWACAFLLVLLIVFRFMASRRMKKEEIKQEEEKLSHFSVE